LRQRLGGERCLDVRADAARACRLLDPVYELGICAITVGLRSQPAFAIQELEDVLGLVDILAQLCLVGGNRMRVTFLQPKIEFFARHGGILELVRSGRDPWLRLRDRRASAR